MIKSLREHLGITDRMQEALDREIPESRIRFSSYETESVPKKIPQP
jgi:hypothetical protein